MRKIETTFWIENRASKIIPGTRGGMVKADEIHAKSYIKTRQIIRQELYIDRVRVDLEDWLQKRADRKIGDRERNEMIPARRINASTYIKADRKIANMKSDEKKLIAGDILDEFLGGEEKVTEIGGLILFPILFDSDKPLEN